MGSASKAVERMGHAAEAPHHSASVAPASKLGQRIGATMATLGAILALFTVTGSAARTELLGLYTQETIASLHAEASATKYRVVETQLRQLRAQSPDPAVVKSVDDELASIAASGPEAARETTIARLAVKPVLSGLTPMPKDVTRFVRLVRGYRAERDAALAWQKTFETSKAALAQAIEHYEWAELCAELGVVASSLALLFSSKKIWLSTVVLGGFGLLIFVATFFPTLHLMHASEAVTADAKARTDLLLETTLLEEAEEEELLGPLEDTGR